MTIVIDTINYFTRSDREYINKRTLEVTGRFQKNYNLETRDKKGNEYWNNESDAFKHAYMQAYMTINYSKFKAEQAGNYHEYEGRKNNQDIREEYMDKHNNKIGREIGDNVKKEYGDSWKTLSEEQKDNIIGVRIIERMQNGELITHPNGSQVYKGKTVDSAKVKGYKGGDLSKMVEKSYSEKFSDKIRKNYKNKKNNYVINSKSSNNTQITGNEHWVTINGKHVLIES